jgi:hypothetical protein
MDIGEEPPLPKDLMLETVRTGPWRQTVESHLTWKKQLLEDITTKQLRANRWKNIKQAEREFKEANDPANYVVENNTTMYFKRVFEENFPTSSSTRNVETNYRGSHE